MKKFSLLIFALLLFVIQTNAQLPVFTDDYAPGVTFTAFGGSVNTLSVDNTQQHSGTASLKIPVTTGYTGGALVSATPTNLSAYNAITFWAKNDNPAFQLDGVGFGNNATTTVFACERNGITLSSTWTKYYIPIPVPSKLTAETGLFHFAEGSGNGAYNIWIDDIQYENVGGGIIGTPTASFATETQSKEVGQTFNATGTTSTYPVNAVGQQMQTARAYFTWTSSNTSVATFDAFGTATALAAGSTTVTGKLGLIDAGGVLTVNVTAVTGPSAAAPTPNRAAIDVKSLFSNQYTNIAVETWSTGWSSCCNVLTDLQIAGNDTKKYQLSHFAGVEFIGAPVDGSAFDNIHFDVWTTSVAKPFTLRLVDFNGAHSEADVTRTPAQNTWVSYDIPLSSFAALASKTKLSQMLFLVDVGTSGTYFIDNVYFYKAGVVVPTDPVVAAPTPPARNAADVISLFSGAYTDRTGTDWFPNWGQTTVVSDVTIAGNATKKYVNLNYQGTNFTPAINATGMLKLHVDIWTPDCTAFEFFLINPGPVEKAVTLNPTLSGWNSFDIDLTPGNFPGINFGDIFQFKFVGNPSGTKVYLDNIYFWKGAPLPVTLSDFTVSKRGNSSVLNWKTSSELNNKGFAVERSANGADWVQLQFVNSNGNSNTTKQYSIVDNSPLQGTNYYRLKQIDFDGKLTYSSTVTVKFSGTGVVGFSFYPNPAKNKITVSLETIESKTASLQLINTDGKAVRNVVLNKQLSNTNVLMDVSNVSKGVYILILRDGDFVKTSKVIID